MTGRRYVGLILATCACAPRSNVPPASDSSITESGTASHAITLYRSPCYARCPAYEVSVTRDGVVKYDGRDQVLRRGAETARIPPARVDALIAELKAAGYFKFADRYRPSERVCGRYVPDAPTVITTVTLGPVTKRIEHDHGCGGAPMALAVLESRIDEVLGTGRWTGR
jgi:hypothetical protein